MATKQFTEKISQLKEKEVSEELMKQVASELDVPLSWVKEAVVKGQSKFTAATMKSNAFDGVRWLWLGKFTAKVKAAQVLKHIKGLTRIQKEFFLSREEFKRYKKRFSYGKK